MSESTEDERSTDNTLAMYIFVNNDLGMGKGKTAGQVGHVVHYLIKHLEQSCCYENPIPDFCKRYKRWEKEGCAKIVLKATTAQLEELLKLPESEYVIDAGKTQIAPNSMTAVGFCPNTKSAMYHITKDYKLLS